MPMKIPMTPSRIEPAKNAINKKRALFTGTFDFAIQEEGNEMLHLHGAGTGAFRVVDQNRLESFEMWCWTRMEKISWTDHVRNKEVLLTVNEQRSILHEIRKRNANWVGHILRRNCLLKHVI